MQSDQFPNLEGLLGLARNDGVDVRPTLLRVLTDFYVQKPTHSVEEERYYTELALRLIDGTHTVTLGIIATRLANYVGAPRTVVEHLSRYLTQTESTGIANELGVPDLSALFFDGDAVQRRLILLNVNYAPIAPMLPPRPTNTLISRLEAAALTRSLGEAVPILEEAFGLSRIKAARVIEDRSGEPMLVAAKALAIPSEIFRRMILFLHPAIGHSVQRVYELAELYDEISVEAALRLITIWRDADVIRHRVAFHRALSWNDENIRVRTAMTPAARRVPQRGRTPYPNNRHRIPGRS